MQFEDFKIDVGEKTNKQKKTITITYHHHHQASPHVSEPAACKPRMAVKTDLELTAQTMVVNRVATVDSTVVKQPQPIGRWKVEPPNFLIIILSRTILNFQNLELIRCHS